MLRQNCLSALAPDHDEKPAITTSGQEHLQLSCPPTCPSGPWMRREQSSVICEGTSVSCRYGRQKVDPGGIEPAQRLIDQMPCFVGVSILVAKPRLPAALVHPSRGQTAIQEIQCRTKPFEGLTTL